MFLNSLAKTVNRIPIVGMIRLMNIEQELLKILPANRIRARYIDRVSFASDAGFYHLLPKAVVQPLNEKEIVALFQFSKKHSIPLVFRAGGSSLSGQSITDGILVDISQHWNKIKLEDSGNRVRVQPGITGAMVNAYLKPHQRKIGPDPSSISAAMMGGILSNNASGMCCGVALNSYHTTRAIRFILPDGKSFDTGVKEDYERFSLECKSLNQVLEDIRYQINSNSTLHQKIRAKYQTKNTVGYSLNAFVDYNHPLDILAHLLIGAEGTLAFIAEAVLETVPDYKYKSTALLYFPSVYAACTAIIPLKEAGALMVELMDRAALHAIEEMEGIPPQVRLLSESAAALLVEFQEENSSVLEKNVQNFLAQVDSLSLLEIPEFTVDPIRQAFYWNVRKGLFPAVGAVRKSGTTVILEDIAFPVEKLGDAIVDLQILFKKYAYHNAIIFGHAKDGNIHFVVTQAFDSQQEITRYDHFMREVVDLVITKYDGTLKAEHGTGRNMAPFVETEWGPEAYQIMKRIKETIDPAGFLNPGVIINADREIHIKNLKELPGVEEEVDRCIECGYCEHKCPSRDLSATPRRRIVIRRALKKLKTDGDQKNYKLLLEQSQNESLDTCAVDGLCATACPVDINTGDLVKRLRRENHSGFQNRLALRVAKNFGMVEWVMRAALRFGFGMNDLFGKRTMYTLTKGIRTVFKDMPLWSESMARVPVLKILEKTEEPNNNLEDGIVYFPACISRMLGTYEGKSKNLMETFMSVCAKANIPVAIPSNIAGTCCSQIFGSKGFQSAYQFTANDVVEKLWMSSKNGKLPVVIDVSSCAYTLHKLRPVLSPENQEKFDRLQILDCVDFLHDRILSKVNVVEKKGAVVLHPVCSLEKMKTGDKFSAIARHFAENVVIPIHSGCCGMAGDRGFLFPELTASATAAEANDLKSITANGYYSSTRTCEMAMTEAVKQNYVSILYLVDEAMESGNVLENYRGAGMIAANFQ